MMLDDVRTHCRCDNELQQALQRTDRTSGSGKARKQVVVLGAGMDTRAWRHAWLQGGLQARNRCAVWARSSGIPHQVLRLPLHAGMQQRRQRAPACSGGGGGGGNMLTVLAVTSYEAALAASVVSAVLQRCRHNIVSGAQHDVLAFLNPTPRASPGAAGVTWHEWTGEMCWRPRGGKMCCPARRCSPLRTASGTGGSLCKFCSTLPGFTAITGMLWCAQSSSRGFRPGRTVTWSHWSIKLVLHSSGL